MHIMDALPFCWEIKSGMPSTVVSLHTRPSRCMETSMELRLFAIAKIVGARASAQKDCIGLFIMMQELGRTKEY